jgi:hypothetical protein
VILDARIRPRALGDNVLRRCVAGSYQNMHAVLDRLRRVFLGEAMEYSPTVRGRRLMRKLIRLRQGYGRSLEVPCLLLGRVEPVQRPLGRVEPRAELVGTDPPSRDPHRAKLLERPDR